ncbi:MAG: DUF1489 domain-containing protein [Paracoccaceae bacterium]
MAVHLIKLCVGADAVSDLEDWQATPAARGPDGLPRHITRMWPKRDTEVLEGGSLYWVFRGQVLARQRILRLDAVQGGDGINRCAIVLDPDVIRTEPAPRRPFQGWRYLSPEDAPRDLPQFRPGDDELPPELAEALAAFGLR